MSVNEETGAQAISQLLFLGLGILPVVVVGSPRYAGQWGHHQAFPPLSELFCIESSSGLSHQCANGGAQAAPRPGDWRQTAHTGGDPSRRNALHRPGRSSPVPFVVFQPVRRRSQAPAAEWVTSTRQVGPKLFSGPN